jgi:hypothetical protein
LMTAKTISIQLQRGVMLETWTLDRWFESSLEHGHMPLAFLCGGVLTTHSRVLLMSKTD